MKYCNDCNIQYDEKTMFCGSCGKKLEEEVDDNNNEDVTALETRQNNKKLSKPLVTLISAVVILICGAICYYVYSNNFTTEAKAKSTVNRYLSAIKKGDSTYDLKHIHVDDFINVLDYKFLRITNQSKEPNELIIDKGTYDMFHKDEFNTFGDWKESIKHQFIDMTVVSENDSEMVLQSSTDMHDKITLLYDVNLTNGLGQSIYKKVKFVVENDDFDHKFKIDEINY